MFLYIVAAAVVAFLVCSGFIGSKWRYYANGYPSQITSLRRFNAFARVWPCDDGFASLKWSAARHTFITIAFSFLVWYVNIRWINSTLLTLCALYALSTVSRYRVRLRDYKDAGDASQRMLRPVKSACFSVVIMSWADYLILMVCYALRP